MTGTEPVAPQHHPGVAPHGVKNRLQASFRSAWKQYAEILAVAFPLVLSSGAHTVQQFIDRMFLAWHSPEALAAATPAGVLVWGFVCVFFGAVGYVSTFIAQYHGAGQPERIGQVMWQAIFIAVLGGVVLLGVSFGAETLFGWVDHDPVVMEMEIIYFRILCYGSIALLCRVALSSFFSGLGITWYILAINTLGAMLNILLDYLMIFGKLGFPEMGIRGAALATVLAEVFMLGLFMALVFGRKNARRYGTRSGWRLQKTLLIRLVRFGLPAGVQMLVDVMGFTVFLIFLGGLGTTAMAATNIAFSINMIAFMPMIGLGMGISVLVGKHLGAKDVASAQRVVRYAFSLMVLYMGVISSLYWFSPKIFIQPFMANAESIQYSEISLLTVSLLKFVAVYSFFDGLSITFSAAIKGAGDTRFVMLMMTVMSLFGFAIPIYIVMVRFNGTIYAAWLMASIYISLLGTAFLLRYLHGRWKTMSVIEEPEWSIAPPTG